MTDVSICSVGSEITAGDQVDANAAWLSQRLRELGLDVPYHLAVGDDLDGIGEGLRWLIDRSDAVMVGGGLGPTHDDVTREAVAAVAGVALESRPELEEDIIGRFAELGVRMPPDNLRQAQLPAGAVGYPPVGTAPGFRLDVERSGGGTCTLHVLPGVPWEMRALYERDVVPALMAAFGATASVTRVVHVTGLGESAAAERLAPVIEAHVDDERLVVSFLATGEEIQVRVTAGGADPDEARARSQPVVDEVRRLLGPAVAGVDTTSIEQALAELLRARDQTVAFAESATAGGISARMARVPGASDVLRGGVAVYATDAKRDVLGIDQTLLDEHGPVSEAVTRELAVRVRELFTSDWGVAVTGVAGPGTQDGLDIGTVVWAVAGPDGEVTVRRGRFTGDREAIQRRLGSAALEALRRRLTAT